MSSYFRHLATTLFQADQAVQLYYMSMLSLTIALQRIWSHLKRVPGGNAGKVDLYTLRVQYAFFSEINPINSLSDLI